MWWVHSLDMMSGPFGPSLVMSPTFVMNWVLRGSPQGKSMKHASSFSVFFPRGFVSLHDFAIGFHEEVERVLVGPLSVGRQRVHDFLAIAFSLDEAVFLEVLQRRINRSRLRALALLFPDFLGDVLARARLLVQEPQREKREKATHVTRGSSALLAVHGRECVQIH